MIKQIYVLDVLALVGAIVASADNVMVFWYCAAVYIVFKSILVYVLMMFQKDIVDGKVETKLLKMAADARAQLARGDHTPIVIRR